ncbi:MAG: NAD(P)-dependent glycerol-3-phosphate dehydrogenase [Alphaproteobacteria bacterium]|nr:NAD(P)-dependent glycerol-3-phosphate dehydrogenase [Alphaproteobacteria bacterium]MBF0250447.1 NAD(P)-dependent glycerol-3-phosphate dehydrogenase [Alphaproteobacteria bacterium]
MQTIGIIGAGAWGTALAAAARRAGRDVVIQAHEPEVAAAINTTHENAAFLPGVALDPAVRATTDLAEAVARDAVLLVAPAQFLRAVCQAAKPHWIPGTPAVICAKGVEKGTYKLMSQVVTETLGDAAPVAVLSGPTFAIEVARDMPTAVTLACADAGLGKRLCETLSSRCFRPYFSPDVVGAQLGGAVKNVMAIACGIVEGRGMGDNARAALITRGLAEIARLGAVLGAEEHTLMGLSGLGDLTLTCNAMQSRNFSLGVALGRGRTLDDILAERKSVTEGVYTAAAVADLARRDQVDMPICQAVNGVLNHGVDLSAIIDGLLSRPLNIE